MKCKLDCPSIMQTNGKPYSPHPQLSCINVLKLGGGGRKNIHMYRHCASKSNYYAVPLKSNTEGF